ncbi:hypothetical protein O0I10_011734 [Lichtheimia ornata]|uniref:Uncharacterized protein n=1 Tax=Lichtheimia ornata TaxID=688661 RepID=A0AAD7XTV4_9FUNG|nr:uncharacterized protein O0I10_011734 [Lichtheimia ornata]KAJ8652656.1 hypothetical protein O0I10_011734 [Lichtheimia ornata]
MQRVGIYSNRKGTTLQGKTNPYCNSQAITITIQRQVSRTNYNHKAVSKVNGNALDAKATTATRAIRTRLELHGNTAPYTSYHDPTSRRSNATPHFKSFLPISQRTLALNRALDRSHHNNQQATYIT